MADEASTRKSITRTCTRATLIFATGLLGSLAALMISWPTGQQHVAAIALPVAVAIFAALLVGSLTTSFIGWMCLRSVPPAVGATSWHVRSLVGNRALLALAGTPVFAFIVGHLVAFGLEISSVLMGLIVGPLAVVMIYVGRPRFADLIRVDTIGIRSSIPYDKRTPLRRFLGVTLMHSEGFQLNWQNITTVRVIFGRSGTYSVLLGGDCRLPLRGFSEASMLESWIDAMLESRPY